MMKPKITVLMSVFNEQTYLRAAIESILNQTFSDFEFLIIDDGSIEPIGDLVSDYRDGRIRSFRQENMGLAKSLNTGLGLARGDYVARMDADDVCSTDRLELQIKEMEAHSQIDLLGSFFDIIDEKGKLLETKELIIDPIYRLWKLQFHNNYGHGTVMLNKQSVLKNGMYDETFLYAQDYDFWSRLSGKKNTGIIPEVLYHYRMVEQSGQASVRNYDAQLAAAIDISNRNLRACNSSLSETDCIDVRALYWKFQLNGVTVKGLKALTDTLDGFCRRYEINAVEKRSLIEKVARDAIAEAEKSDLIATGDKQRLMDELELLSSKSRISA
jgi:glycosyltransferase involved in cell wall biosynthesis